MGADPLKQYIENLGLKSSLFFRSHLCGPWGLYQRQADEMLFHFLVNGTCFVRPGGKSAPPIELRSGDLVLFPKGSPHCVASDERTPYIESDKVCYTVERDKYRFLSGSGKESVFLCGSFKISHWNCRALLASLPDLIHIRLDDTPKHSWIRSTLSLVEAETYSEGSASALRMTHLLDTLFEQILRWYLEESDAIKDGLLAGLRDPFVGKALEAVIADLRADWSLQSLASVSGLSRTAFAEKFAKLVGESPMSFVRNERLRRAERLLTDSNITIKQIAFECGFATPASLSRSFERAYGQTPTEYRLTTEALVAEKIEKEKPMPGGDPHGGMGGMDF